MNDTSESIQQYMREQMQAKTPSQRLRMASGMFDAGKQLALAGIMHDHPGLNEKQLRARLFMRLYGQDFSPQKCAEIISKLPNMQLD
jgi:uncharacterized protein YneF (UPF0154 family)